MRKPLLFLLFAPALAGFAEILLPDPTIFQDGGAYYLTGTHYSPEAAADAGKKFAIYKSENLADWRAGGDGGEPLFALGGKNLLGFDHFWAPQIFKKDGKYYFAYTTSTKPTTGALQHLRIAIASADNIEGGFKDAFVLQSPAPEIDPFVFIDDDGSAYIYLVNWANGGGIWVQRLSPDLKTRLGEMKSCVRVSEDWERRPLPEEFAKLNAEAKKKNPQISPWKLYKASRNTAEGPTVVKRGGKYVLFYSANDFRSPDYCVCAAVADSPMGEFKKIQRAPVISRFNVGLNGSGHGDVFFDKSGGMWYVFHAHHSNIRISPRRAAVVKLVETFGADGYPRYDIDYSTMRLL